MKSPWNESNMAEQQNIPQKETEEEQPEQLKENQEKRDVVKAKGEEAVAICAVFLGILSSPAYYSFWKAQH